MSIRTISKVILGVLLVTTAPLMGEQRAKKLFSQANNLYQKSKFEQAMNVYKRIENKNAFVHYNLGNCAYKLKRYGWALLYWRRAEKEWGFASRSELIENITLLQQKLKIRPTMYTAAKIKNLTLSWLRSMPLIIIQLLFLLLWLFLFVYIRFLYKKRKKWTISTLFALIAFFGILLVVRYSIDAKRYGVVVSQQAQLLSGPSETFQTLMQVGTAHEVIIKKETDNYYKVQAHKQLGWMSKKDVVGI